MSQRYWIVKQEPAAYAWEDFVRDGKTAWTGVRNFTARNNLRAMRAGDLAFYYHSVVGKEIVGIAQVVREAYPDPTAQEGAWVCVDLAPQRALPRPVTLEEIKMVPALANLPLVRQGRLSVSPLSAPEFQAILKMAGAGEKR